MYGLDQRTLLESISKHLDSLAMSIKWAILFAIPLWWTGLQHQNPIEAFGMKLQREHAFVLGAIAYSVVNAVVLLKLLRLGDLMLAISDASLPEGVARLVTHSWEFNPFAYFGSGFSARAHSCLGFGSLIVIWWLSNSSLSALGLEGDLVRMGLLNAFLMVGIASMIAIRRVNKIILRRTGDSHPDLHSALSAVENERNRFSLVGIGIGGALAFLTNWLILSKP